MYSNLILEVKNGVAHLTLNRPDAANGINLELARRSSTMRRANATTIPRCARF